MPTPVLPLLPDELLSTTRSIRKRLDLSRPVDRSLLEECLQLAQYAPTGGNVQGWHFVVVTDAAKRAALAELYRNAWALYRAAPGTAASRQYTDPVYAATQERVVSSAQYLADHLHEVPVYLIPCISGRAESQPLATQAVLWGSILPAAWSFMLAARSRGLGTTWTTLHLMFEAEAAAILGIPQDTVTQVALIPVAHIKGAKFSPAPRTALDSVVHWDQW